VGELYRAGVRVRLQEQPFRVLAALLERPGDLITREELRLRLWPEDTFVDFERGLNTAVKKLRQALQDDARNPRFVETLPRRGYRFLAPVQPVAAETAGIEPGPFAAPAGELLPPERLQPGRALAGLLPEAALKVAEPAAVKRKRPVVIAVWAPAAPAGALRWASRGRCRDSIRERLRIRHWRP
jgi:DNA-binding winged helix-turn-helix (wHTH) protein